MYFVTKRFVQIRSLGHSTYCTYFERILHINAHPVAIIGAEVSAAEFGTVNHFVDKDFRSESQKTKLVT